MCIKKVFQGKNYPYLIIIFLIFISCLTPLISFFLNQRVIATFSSYSLITKEGFFIHNIFQERPTKKFVKSYIFLKKPKVFSYENSLSIVPNEKEGFFALPRGLYFEKKELLNRIMKKLHNKKLNIWFIIDKK